MELRVYFYTMIEIKTLKNCMKMEKTNEKLLAIF